MCWTQAVCPLEEWWWVYHLSRAVVWLMPIRDVSHWLEWIPLWKYWCGSSGFYPLNITLMNYIKSCQSEVQEVQDWICEHLTLPGHLSPVFTRKKFHYNRITLKGWCKIVDKNIAVCLPGQLLVVINTHGSIKTPSAMATLKASCILD